jgi:hypothetical protein
MAHVKLQVKVPGQASKRYSAGRFRKGFYLRSLLPDDPFSRLNPGHRFTEIYFQTFDEEGPIYKIFLEEENRLVMIDCSGSWRYIFTAEEIAQGELAYQKNFFYGGQSTSEIMVIECVSTLRKYETADEFLADADQAWTVYEFRRRLAIVRETCLAVNISIVSA